MKLFPFVVRVYGICYDQERGILVSDEFIYGQYICKFPGGGLQFGEGTIDCLKREMMEEAGQEFEVLEHFYTTDFFVPSAFDADVQVLSIYYFIRPLQPLKIKISDKAFDFPELKPDVQSFRWINLAELSANQFSLPIDQRVAELLHDFFAE